MQWKVVTPLDDGGGGPVFGEVVYALAGRPARVSLSAAAESAGPSVMHGTVAGVTERYLEFDAITALWPGHGGTTLTLEVVMPQALVQCLAAVQEVRLPHRLLLQWPERLVLIERRRHPRTEVALPISFNLQGANRLHRGLMTNLSAGGLAFEAKLKLQPGSLLEIDLAEAAGEPVLRIAATVVRCIPVPGGIWHVAAQWCSGTDNEVERLLSCIGLLPDKQTSR